MVLTYNHREQYEAHKSIIQVYLLVLQLSKDESAGSDVDKKKGFAIQNKLI